MVFTLDKRKRPLGWCTPKRARNLLKQKRAVVYRQYPYVIILKDKDSRLEEINHSYRIKIDPGAKHTGITVLDGDCVVLFLQIEHRGEQVVKNLQTRQAVRRNRRQRKTWYRHCKYPRGNAPTARPEGWLPPSQHSIADNVINTVNKLIRWIGSCDVTIESAKFDTQLMEDADIEGKQYQQGTLFGYEMKSYLREKYGCTCQYCGGKTEDRRLEWDHKIPRSKGGSDSVKNATLACHTCNEEKKNHTPEEWLGRILAKKHRSKIDEARIAGIQKVICGKKTTGLRYSAWVNTSRWYLVNQIKAMPKVKDIELSSGGMTEFNRHVLGYPKDHHFDALCVGKVIDDRYRYDTQPCLYIKAMGRGTRLRGHLNSCGIITVKYRERRKAVNGLQTGDIVQVTIPSGKYKGKYVGRVMVRSTGYHDIRCSDGNLVTGSKKSNYRIIQHKDGYQYSWTA